MSQVYLPDHEKRIGSGAGTLNELSVLVEELAAHGGFNSSGTSLPGWLVLFALDAGEYIAPKAGG